MIPPTSRSGAASVSSALNGARGIVPGHITRVASAISCQPPAASGRSERRREAGVVAFNRALILQTERLRPGPCVGWIAKCRNCDAMRARAEAACVGQVEELSETVGGADALFTARREADRAGCRCNLDQLCCSDIRAHVALATVRLRTEFDRLAGVPCVHGNGQLLSNRWGNRDQLENARIRTVHGT